MTDIGLYNYIKKELAEGKTKEQISVTLAQGGGWSRENIDAGFVDVQSGNPPVLSNETVLTNSKKGGANKILTTVIILTLVFAGAYYFLTRNNTGSYSDIAHFDDSKLNVESVQVSDTQNANNDFFNIKNELSSGVSQKASDYLAEAYPNQQQISEAKTFVKQQSKLLDVFYGTVGKPYYYCDLRDVSNNCSLNGVRTIAFIAAVNSDLQFRDGKYKEALTTGFDILNLGQKIEGSSDTMITYLVGIAVKQIALKRINLMLASSTLNITQSDRSAFLADLAKSNDNETGQKNALKGEYSSFVASVIDTINPKDFSTLTDQQYSDLGIPTEFKKVSANSSWEPNNTKKMFYGVYMSMIEDVDKPCGSTYKQNETIDISKLSSKEENLVGKILYYTLLPKLSSVNLKRCEVIVLSETAQSYLSQGK